jgi:flagellar basal-body rod protein FlgB
MIEESNKLFNKNSHKLEMASTNKAHITTTSDSITKADIFYRDGHMAKNDGNSVDIDVETTEMSKNGVMYNGLISALRKDIGIFKMVIDSSSKTN